MKRSLGVALCAMWSAGYGLCQDLSPYESFFRQVLQIRDGTLLNGQVTDGFQPRLKNAIPLTDDEIQLLNTIAGETDARLRRFDEGIKPFALESLFRNLESETDPTKPRPDPVSSRSQQQSKIDYARKRVLREAVEQINKALGDSRFEMLDGYVRRGTLGTYIRAVVPSPAKKKL